MLIAKKAWLLALSISGISSQCRLVAQTPEVITCSQATLTRPEVGRSFRGVVTNDDYRFSATVPAGYTGWDGVAANAPFHGFTIFLDHSRQSCILFEVHIRVEDADAPHHPHAARTLSLGRASAWQTSSFAKTRKGAIVNLKTVFTFVHDGEVDDGQVTLISPAAEQPNATPVYDGFLKSVHFGTN